MNLNHYLEKAIYEKTEIDLTGKATPTVSVAKIVDGKRERLGSIPATQKASGIVAFLKSKGEDVDKLERIDPNAMIKDLTDDNKVEFILKVGVNQRYVLEPVNN